MCAAPAGHWHTTTFVCGLRHDGLVTPLVLDCAVNGAVFLAYVEPMLAPTLGPGDLVVLDNLSSHEVAGVRDEMDRRTRQREWWGGVMLHPQSVLALGVPLGNYMGLRI